MELKELLEYFNTSDTIGENPEAIELMRSYSREAQKRCTRSCLLRRRKRSK